LVLLSGMFLIPRGKRGAKWIYTGSVAGLSVLLGTTYLSGPDKVFPLNIDQYKALAYVQRLVAQGTAERKVTLYGPRGRVDLFASPSFHAVLSLNTTDVPPPMDVVLVDGFQAGTMLDITTTDQARFLEGTLSALPYKLVKPERILILGEAGSIYLWLARLSSAASIVLVQPDENIRRVLETHPSGVLADPRITVVAAEPRAFLDKTRTRFDIIHLASMEGFSPGSGGIAGLREDYLGTAEGFSRCLNALTPGGIASVVRGIQDPARDNIKIAATWIEALERNDVKEPGKHIILARDELAVATLVGRSPFSANLVRELQLVCSNMSWDLDWFPGVRPEQTNKIHLLAGPEGGKVSWYYHAMKKILSPEREDFYRTWICNIQPATDDRPFFFDFFRWDALSRLRSVFGPQWPARAEMGFLVLVLATIWTALAAAVLLPGPIILLQRGKATRRISLIAWTVAYFAALGTGFMFLEMSFIQMFTRFLGDPVLAAALVVGGFLFFAGLGSISQPRITGRLRGGVFATAVAVGLLVLFDIGVFSTIFETAADLPGVWKAVAGLTMIAPLAFLMGTPFPWGLSMLHENAASAVPVAWAVNGFASVVSACGAVLLAMTCGFKSLFVLAAVLYATAGLLSLLFVRWTKTGGVDTNIPLKEDGRQGRRPPP
jgi:spermidine synthase